jgi:hypothetical protein
MPQNLTGDLSESPGGFQRRAARNMQGLAAERDKPPLLNLSCHSGPLAGFLGTLPISQPQPGMAAGAPADQGTA